MRFIPTDIAEKAEKLIEESNGKLPSLNEILDSGLDLLQCNDRYAFGLSVFAITNLVKISDLDRAWNGYESSGVDSDFKAMPAVEWADAYGVEIAEKAALRRQTKIINALSDKFPELDNDEIYNCICDVGDEDTYYQG